MADVAIKVPIKVEPITIVLQPDIVAQIAQQYHADPHTSFTLSIFTEPTPCHHVWQGNFCLACGINQLETSL